MATYRKRGNTWRAEIRTKGICLSSSFTTKAEAREWATQKEADILAGKLTIADPKEKQRLVREVFTRYAEEVSPTKAGWRWECIRLKSLCRDALGKVPLNELSPQHMGTFRDKRLKTVSASTVNRELTLISSVFTKARKEWGWLKENPVYGLDRPKQPRPRERRISQDEINRVILALGFVDGQQVSSRKELVGLLFLLAIETGMRLGELCQMHNESVNLPQKYVQLLHTKNGDRRQVPLSPRALELCTQFLETNVTVSAHVAGALFRSALKEAEIQDLHFHDTRHEAITRLSKKLDVLALARMVGHRDIKNLMIYYNESATELAAMLG